MRFDLTDLKLFLAISETGSITAGAERAHMALASASARVCGMEETLGVQLLARNRRGVQPTPAGQALIHHARMVLEQVERMKGELTEFARGLKGHVRLMASSTALSEFLPESLGAFLALNPNVDVDLEERTSYEIARAVAEGRADLGIMADTVDPGGLEVFPLHADQMMVVTYRGHPFGARPSVSFVELLDEPLVGMGAGSALYDVLAGYAMRLGRRPNYRVRLRSFEAVCRMVEQGVGIGVVPETAAQRCRATMDLAMTPLSDPWARRRLMLCARSFATLPGHARLLADHIRDAAA
jgi:molybdate transport repressor ModE-like protein